VKNSPEQSSADRSKGFMSYGLEEIYAILNVPIIWVCVRIHSTRQLTHNRHPEGLLREGEKEMRVTESQKRETGKFVKRLVEIRNQQYGTNDTPEEYIKKCVERRNNENSRSV